MIPKLIHNIWIQGYDNLPEQNKKNNIQIRKLNTDWKFIMWDENMILDLLTKYPKILYVYKNIKKLHGLININASKSDIARYIIMKEYGGLYYDLDFVCSASFNQLFSNDNNNNTIYIASSKIDFLDYVYPFNKPKYCACFMAFPKEHPIWNLVIHKIINATSKYQIGEALDRTLQENNNKYNIILLDKINGHYSCNKNGICTTPVESSWNPIRNLMQYINCHYKWFYLTLFIIIIFLFKIPVTSNLHGEFVKIILCIIIGIVLYYYFHNMRKNI